MTFVVDDKVTLLDAEPYKQYKKMLTSDSLVFRKGVLNKVVVPPSIANVDDTLDQLKRKRAHLMRDYHDLYSRIVSTNDAKHLRNDYESVFDRIIQVDADIDKCYAYLERVNVQTDDALMPTLREISTLEKMDVRTKADNRKLVQLYKDLLRLSALAKPDKVNFIIEELPSFKIGKKGKLIDRDEEELKELKEPKQPKQPKQPKEPKEPKQPKEPKETKEKEKKAPAKVSEKQVTAIKANVKDLIDKTFKFKNIEECTSQKRSQPYYMSKESILKEIEANPDMKALMPSKYKTLSKEELCKYLQPIKI